MIHDGEKLFVVRRLLEQPGTKISAVEDVIDHPSDIDALDSTHAEPFSQLNS